MRTFNLTNDIIAILEQLARTHPDVYLTYDVDRVAVVKTDELGVFDLVFIESDETELVFGEIVLDDDYEASFEIFED